jgi:DNA (cytosine-5)-methyltransferase 1
MTLATTSASRAATEHARGPLVAHHRGRPARPRRGDGTPDISDLRGIRDFFGRSRGGAAPRGGVLGGGGRSRGRPTAVDLFCGAGGLSLGLERAGFDVLLGADSDEWAVSTHDANLPGLSWCGDLSDPSEFLGSLDVWGLEGVDLVAGGVPCQPFSRAGRSRIENMVATGERNGHDSRADLWSSFIAVVETLRPSAVLVENVPDLPRWNDGAVLIGLYESLGALGYRVEARILDGFRHGVPQHRQRLVLIGLDGQRQPNWPEPRAGRVNLRDAIGDLPPIPRAQRSETLAYDERRQTSDYQRLMRRDVPAADRDRVFEHICRDVRPDDMEAFRLLQEGQTYIDLPERLRRYRSDVFTDKYKRLAWSELCRSITAHIGKDGYWYIHPDQHRTLSIREAARVQSFPDEFRFGGTQTHRYRQIGNAVPVLLGEAVGRSILEGMARPAQGRRDAAREGFRDLLVGWRMASVAWSPSWRRSEDPWLVLVAETALVRASRAEAERVFAALRRVAPDPASLLRTDDPEALLLGAGVKKDRAHVLVEIARVLLAEHGGAVPDDEMALRLLPGVGDNVCCATLTFGFGRRQILLDRTTARIAGRVVRHDDRSRFQLRLDLHRLAGSAGPDAAFNRALLDLAREFCVVSQPLCTDCPLTSRCAHARQNRASTVADADESPAAEEMAA